MCPFKVLSNYNLPPPPLTNSVLQSVNFFSMVVYNPWIIKNIFSYLCHSKFCQVASTTTYDQHFQLTVFPSQIDLLSMNFWNPELVTKLLYLSPISMHSFVTQAKNSVIFSLVFPKVISAIMVNFKWQKISICKWE